MPSDSPGWLAVAELSWGSVGSRELKCRRGAALGDVRLCQEHLGWEGLLQARRACAPHGACWRVPELKPFPALRPGCALGCGDVAEAAGKSVYFPPGRGGGAAVLRHVSM